MRWEPGACRRGSAYFSLSAVVTLTNLSPGTAGIRKPEASPHQPLSVKLLNSGRTERRLAKSLHPSTGSILSRPGVRHTSSMQATTVLVEGESDRLAVETLALRLGHDLTALRVSVVPMGGATSIVHFIDRYGPNGAGHRLFGLCDAGESRGVARALGRAGIGSGSLAELGFYVCDADLEDELIRCLGIDAVLNVIAAQGELASFRLLQRQPSLRDRPITAQLRRFFGGRSGNKVRYAPLLVDALPAGHAPAPLARLVASFSR